MASTHSGLVSRVRVLLRSPGFAKLWRYGAVSVVSTALSLLLLYLFFRVAGMTATEANIVATVLATPPNYYLNRSWAWGKTGKSHIAREVIPFWVIAAAGLVLSTLAVTAADHAAHHAGLGHHLETLVVLGANFFTYGVIWVGKFILFNRVLFVDRPEGLADVVTQPDAPGEAPLATPRSPGERPALRVLRGDGSAGSGGAVGSAVGSAATAGATPRAERP